MLNGPPGSALPPPKVVGPWGCSGKVRFGSSRMPLAPPPPASPVLPVPGRNCHSVTVPPRGSRDRPAFWGDCEGTVQGVGPNPGPMVSPQRPCTGWTLKASGVCCGCNTKPGCVGSWHDLSEHTVPTTPPSSEARLMGPGPPESSVRHGGSY